MKTSKRKTLIECEVFVKQTITKAKARRKLREARAFLEIEKNKAKLGEKFNPMDPYAEEEW